MLKEKQIHSFPSWGPRFLALTFYHLVVILIPGDSIGALQIKNEKLGSAQVVPLRLGGPGGSVWWHPLGGSWEGWEAPPDSVRMIKPSVPILTPFAGMFCVLFLWR